MTSATASPLERLIRGLEWSAAAFFLFMRPLVTGPLTGLDAEAANLLLASASWAPLFLSFLGAALTGEFSGKRPRSLLPAAAVLAALGIGALHPADKSFSLARLADLGGALALAAWFLQQGRAVAARALWLALAGGAAAVAVGIFQAGGGLALMRAETRQEIAEEATTNAPFVEPDWKISMRDSRLATDEVFGTFFPFYSNTFAGYLAMLLPIVAGILWDLGREKNRGALRGLLGSLAAAALVCLVRTGSQGGWVAAAFGALFLVLRAGGASPLLPWKCLAAAAGGVALAYALGWRHPSVDVRLGYWAGTLRMIWDHLFFGIGAGSAHLFYDLYRIPGGGDVRFAHNALLELAAEGGLLLAATFTWFMVEVSRFRISARTAPETLPTEKPGFPFAWGAAVIAGGWLVASLGKLYPRTGYLEAEMILAATAAVACLALWTLGPGSGTLPWGQGTRAGLAAGVAAGSVHLLGDFGLQVQGFSGSFLAFAGILAAVNSPEEKSRPVPLSGAGRIALVGSVAAAGFFLLYALPSRRIEAAQALALLEQYEKGAGPDERRELAEKYLRRALCATPWNTELAARQGFLYGNLWRQDRREEDRAQALDAWRRVARRRPTNGQPLLEMSFLVKGDDTPALILEATRRLGEAAELLPRWPRPRLELARRFEAIRLTPELLAAYAQAEELPEPAAAQDLARRAGRLFGEALALDAMIPDPQHKLDEPQRRLIQERLKQ